MNISLTKLIEAFSAKQVSARPVPLNTYCIVRCQKAGVHAGIVVRADSEWVVLQDSRRLWRWHSGFTLSEAATAGIDNAKSRVSCALEELIIPAADIAEIIPCSIKARSTIEAADSSDG